VNIAGFCAPALENAASAATSSALVKCRDMASSLMEIVDDQGF
jgi:hypothetical protein